MLLNTSEIKPAFDSIEMLNRQMYNDPELQKINQETKASPAMLAEIMAEPPGLESYKAAYKDALNKLRNTPEYKKHMADIKKYNDLVEKVKKTPYHKP
jgi:GTP1/Obg family GTP-binding protein